MADYPLTPDRITNIGFEMKTTIVKFENGVEQRSSDQAIPVQTFRLYHQALDAAHLQTLTDFFIARKGQTESFNFYDYRTQTTFTVRFKDDNISGEPINAYFTDVYVEVITC